MTNVYMLITNVSFQNMIYLSTGPVKNLTLDECGGIVIYTHNEDILWKFGSSKYCE